MLNKIKASSKPKDGRLQTSYNQSRPAASTSQRVNHRRSIQGPVPPLQKPVAQRLRPSSKSSSFVLHSKSHDRAHPYDHNGHSRSRFSRNSFYARKRIRDSKRHALPGQWLSFDSDIAVTKLPPARAVTPDSNARDSFHGSLAVHDEKGGSTSSEYQLNEVSQIGYDNALDPGPESDEEILIGDIVIRDAPSPGPFHPPWLTRQKPELPCTNATQGNALHLKRVARILKSLPDAHDIYVSLMDRLERMLETERELSTHDPNIVVSLSTQTSKLADFLKATKDGRIATGERAVFVEAELKWANWIDDAASVGVLHLKPEDCQCRRYWNDDD